MHCPTCGSNLSFNVYTVGDILIAFVNLLKNLSVMRSADGRYIQNTAKQSILEPARWLAQ